MTATTDRYQVPALRRTQDLLEILMDAAAPVRASALVEATGMSRSTLYLLLDSLEQRRWIEKRDNGYIIGVRLFELGSAYVRHDGLQAAFRIEAAAFVAAYNEAVQLAMLDGTDVVYLAREDSQRPVRLVSDPGSRLSAHCCALGKALLASLADSEVAALLPERLPAITQRTMTRRSALLLELASVRKSGLAVEREEVSEGLACFAAYVGVTPLRKRVAVSTSVPVARLTPRRERQLSTGIARVAAQVGKQIGKRVRGG